MNDLNTLLIWLQEHWLELIITIAIAFVIARLGGWIIAPVVRRLVGRLHNDLSHEDVIKRQDTLISILHTFLKVLVWTFTIFIILGMFGVNLAALLAGASILGVALGFGAQSLVKDFLSGLFIILENQYRVGDVVDLEGSAGTVEHITLRSTTVRDADGNVHYIPNGNIMRVINKTMGFSVINLTIAVKPTVNVDHLAEIINELGEKFTEEEKWKDNILVAPHFSNLGTFTDASMEVKITGKTQPSKQWSVTGELRKRLLIAFKKHHIELAQIPSSGVSIKKN